MTSPTYRRPSLVVRSLRKRILRYPVGRTAVAVARISGYPGVRHVVGCESVAGGPCRQRGSGSQRSTRPIQPLPSRSSCPCSALHTTTAGRRPSSFTSPAAEAPAACRMLPAGSAEMIHAFDRDGSGGGEVLFHLGDLALLGVDDVLCERLELRVGTPCWWGITMSMNARSNGSASSSMAVSPSMPIMSWSIPRSPVLTPAFSNSASRRHRRTRSARGGFTVLRLVGAAALASRASAYARSAPRDALEAGRMNRRACAARAVYTFG